MKRSFVDYLEDLSNALDYVDNDTFDRVMVMVESVLKESLIFDKLDLCVDVLVNGQLGLRSAWNSDRNTWVYQAKDSRGNYSTLQALSYYTGQPIWVVASNQGPLDSADQYTDEWSHLDSKQIPRHIGTDISVHTSVSIPSKIFPDTINGVITFESKKRLQHSTTIKDVLKRIASSIGIIYYKNNAYIHNKELTTLAVKQLEDIRFEAPKQLEDIRFEAPSFLTADVAEGAPNFEYRIALSFAGEDRLFVRQIADALSARGVKVFFDEYEKATLWGKELSSQLDEIYRKKAEFCILFISHHYAQKPWPKRERESALARALSEFQEYILPIRIDGTDHLPEYHQPSDS